MIASITDVEKQLFVEPKRWAEARSDAESTGSGIDSEDQITLRRGGSSRDRSEATGTRSASGPRSAAEEAPNDPNADPQEILLR